MHANAASHGERLTPKLACPTSLHLGEELRLLDTTVDTCVLPCYADGTAAQPGSTALSAAASAIGSVQLSADPSAGPWPQQQQQQQLEDHLHRTTLYNSNHPASSSHSSAHNAAGTSSLSSLAQQLPSVDSGVVGAVPDVSTAAAPGDLPPRWFLAYPHLQQLRVTACGATGQLPVELLSARQLSSLVLSRNKIRGTLPSQLVLLQVSIKLCPVG